MTSGRRDDGAHDDTVPSAPSEPGDRARERGDAGGDAGRGAAGGAVEAATVPGRGPRGATGPQQGRTWARYVVLEPLGEGGMGAVWAAYDTELERKVALKVLHDELLGRASQERLRREAKAMARVSHPNVVPVFDVGEHAGRSYYTMELVRGVSLKDWAKAPRPWREVARVFAEAARGLAAIHAAGLAHRDVKPGNLLLGDDGRARIADLGIAMSAAEVGPADASDAPEPVPLVATTTLRHAGTPAYMAPEQLRGAAGDARSDQFSFGVALWELLHGQPPFGGATVAARLAAMDGAPAAARDVPGWLDAAARRALAIDPAARFDDLDALAAALVEPRRRRWPLAAGGAALLAAATTALVLAWPRGAPPADPCARAGTALDAAWTPARRDALRAALAAARGPDRASPDAVLAALDRAVAGWRDASRTACARDAGGQWTPSTGVRAQACLDRRARALRAALGSRDGGAVASAAAHLDPTDICLDADYLDTQVEPPGPGDRALADGAIALLDEVKLLEVDAPDVAARIVDAVARMPLARSYQPLGYEVASTRADLALARGDFRPAAQMFEDQYYAARAAGDDDGALAAASRLVQLAAGQLGDRELAARWIKLARADAARRPNAFAVAQFLLAASAVEVEWGDSAAAIDDAERMVRLVEKSWGADGPFAANAVGALAIAYDAAGRHRDAVDAYRRDLGMLEGWYPADSPELVDPLENLALAESDLGQTSEAIARMTRAYTIATGWADAPPSMTGGVALNLGTVLYNAGLPDQAAPVLERAVAALRTAYGDGHRDVAMAMVDLGLARAELAGADRAKLAAALEVQRRAAEATRAADGADAPEAVDADLDVADTLMRLGRCDEVRAIGARLQPIADREAAPAHRGQLLEQHGRCAAAAGDDAAAIDELGRAVAAFGDEANLRHRAAVRRELARAQLRRGDRAGAVATERARRADLAAGGLETGVMAAIDAWLAAPTGEPP